MTAAWVPGDPVHPPAPGVPATATRLPEADTFEALRELHDGRVDKRRLLRVAFEFAWLDISGPLRDVATRALTVRPTRFGEYKVWCFTNRTVPVPAVWVWTLAEVTS